MIDNLIIALSVADGVHRAEVDVMLDDQRVRTWKHVFSDQWNTNRPFQHPGNTGARRARESSVLVGKLKVDHPPSKKSPVVPAHRRAGAVVYMKPNLKWDENTVSFMLLDARGASIKSEHLVYGEGLTPEMARANSMVHFDKSEVRRICNYNEHLVTYWARLRLVADIRTFPARYGGAAANSGDASRPVFGPEALGMLPEDISELAVLRTCKDIMDAWSRMKMHAQVIAGPGGNKRFLTSQLADSD
ncbi:hypothetical protein B0T25DRAFT_293264 [Lasiosphaeria hispida]|uniref:Uncharacterized protein n=1 Tax=Lasiosphaeria hispida TaxID=260671 RepID=A0AAJ0HCE5_9PEZI|nr:hypothetical protein B0T25DRAFT_293264 [Lasiosphaeria hispida]